ncbi:MAG: Gfo/Idh/MocA family oxidoreductase [Lentisphaeria bacterium]|jgi:predicted dehydrogenase|nr:Gfo/Idh/MocA family oxidoreductase [Lentisphaeria bacterium]
MEKIKIGQIGITHEHASGKISTLKKMPDVFEIVGVVDDRHISKGATFLPADLLKPYEGLTFMTEEELFNVPGLQAVTVETPNADLVPTAIRCLERDLAMHMDKPGGEYLDLYKKLRKGCEDRGLPFQIGYMFRGNPAVQFCKRIVREKWLGEIYEIQATMSHNYGNDAYNEYLSTFKGGIVYNLICHLIDFIVPMMGAPEKVTPFLKSTAGALPTAGNNGLAILEYPHATVTLRACSIELNAGGQGGRPLKISGTNGTAYLCPLERFDGQALKLHLALREGNAEYAAGAHVIEFEPQADRYEVQLLELARIINGEMTNPYSYEHDVLVQEILLAASGCTQWG